MSIVLEQGPKCSAFHSSFVSFSTLSEVTALDVESTVVVTEFAIEVDLVTGPRAIVFLRFSRKLSSCTNTNIP